MIKVKIKEDVYKPPYLGGKPWFLGCKIVTYSLAGYLQNSATSTLAYYYTLGD